VTANPARSRGRLRGLLTLTILFALLHTAAAAQTSQPKIDILQVGGALDGTIADYLDRALRRAADEDVEVVVLQLATPGALNVETSALVDLITSSPVPVAVWAGPPGARVTGGGVQLAMAADILALAPGTVLGGAFPEALGDEPDAAARQEIAQRLADLAAARGRDPDVAAGFARDGAAVVAAFDAATGSDVAAAPPAGVDPDNVLVLEEQQFVDAGIADLVAASLPEVLQSLDGREVTRPGGEQTRLRVDPVTASIRFNNQGLLGRVLHAVSTPTLAYLLLVGGLVALLFEWFQPGFGVAGISGVVLAALGAFGFAVLPTQWWALALVILGLVLLALDLALAALGPLTIAGTAALVAGSVWLYRGPQALRLAGWVIALVVVGAVAFFVFVMTTVLRAQGVQARAGMQAALGKHGVVRSMLNPQGHVFVDGVLWRAQAPESAGQIRTGTAVLVTGVADDMTLMVEPVDAPQESEPTRP
jgi:membrane-bound serine protease (ClpP class)